MSKRQYDDEETENKATEGSPSGKKTKLAIETSSTDHKGQAPTETNQTETTQGDIDIKKEDSSPADAIEKAMKAMKESEENEAIKTAKEMKMVENPELVRLFSALNTVTLKGGHPPSPDQMTFLRSMLIATYVTHEEFHISTPMRDGRTTAIHFWIMIHLSARVFTKNFLIINPNNRTSNSQLSGCVLESKQIPDIPCRVNGDTLEFLDPNATVVWYVRFATIRALTAGAGTKSQSSNPLLYITDHKGVGVSPDVVFVDDYPMFQEKFLPAFLEPNLKGGLRFFFSRSDFKPVPDIPDVPILAMKTKYRGLEDRAKFYVRIWENPTEWTLDELNSDIIVAEDLTQEIIDKIKGLLAANHFMNQYDEACQKLKCTQTPVMNAVRKLYG